MLRLLLVKDDKIIRSIPLSIAEMPSEKFGEEMDGFLEKLAKYEQITEALCNLNRLRILRYLMDEDDFTHSFSDFLKELGMNPKIVREHTAKLKEAGFVEPMGRGKYRFSERGRALFMTAGLAVMSVVEVLEEEV
jgi:DNA-binding transcriptional ArsR family regulator